MHARKKLQRYGAAYLRHFSFEQHHQRVDLASRRSGYAPKHYLDKAYRDPKAQTKIEDLLEKCKEAATPLLDCVRLIERWRRKNCDGHPQNRRLAPSMSTPILTCGPPHAYLAVQDLVSTHTSKKSSHCLHSPSLPEKQSPVATAAFKSPVL